MIVTAGAIDCHVHFICPQLAYEAISSGKLQKCKCFGRKLCAKHTHEQHKHTHYVVLWMRNIKRYLIIMPFIGFLLSLCLLLKFLCFIIFNIFQKPL